MSQKNETQEPSEEDNTLELKIKELTLRIRLRWVAELFKMFLSLPVELVIILLQFFRKRPKDENEN